MRRGAGNHVPTRKDRVYRGSRKHILDWTEQPGFAADLLGLIGVPGVHIPVGGHWMPRGYRQPREARLETFGPVCIPGDTAWAEVRGWWLVHERGANTPNWDLAVGCEIEGRPGLVLVEAKANDAELKVDRKKLSSRASQHSRENHDHIGSAIARARDELRRMDAGVNISRDSHYQLANRVAFTWKLASVGIPVILVYLGFLGDSGITDAGMPFESADGWQSVFESHTNGIVPLRLFERRLDLGRAPAWRLLRSRPVMSVSPPPFRR